MKLHKYPEALLHCMTLSIHKIFKKINIRFRSILGSEANFSVLILFYFFNLENKK